MATCSGDTTIKIWDFSQKKCIHTFTNHLLPGRRFPSIFSNDDNLFFVVWSVHFHSCGDFIASASQDKTVSIMGSEQVHSILNDRHRRFSLSSLRCRTVMRGHQDSVHSAELLMFFEHHSIQFS